MSTPPTTLRATTHLADRANQRFDEWISSLRSSGFEIEGARGDDDTLDADLVFACGLLTVIRIDEGEERHIVGAPLFPGETQPTYRSVLIVGASSDIDELSEASGARLAVNEFGSWSGWHGAKAHFRSTGLPATCVGEHVITGGHALSIEAVLDGSADLASIDHTVWDDFRSTNSRADQLRVIGSTPDWPAPPLSIRASLSSEVRHELTQALLAMPDIVTADPSDYRFMLDEVQEYPTWP